MHEQKENLILKEKLQNESAKIPVYKAEIDYLKNQLRTIEMDKAMTSVDEDTQIKQQAIYKAELRVKDREIEALREELQTLQKVSSEHSLYLEFSALKQEVKKQQQIIETQQIQIEQLEKHIALIKS